MGLLDEVQDINMEGFQVVSSDLFCNLLIPVSAKDKDSIRWMLSGKEPHGRKLECRAFAEKLFQMWGWSADRVYKSTGRIVVSDQKVMLFFDFNSPDSWPYGSRTKAQKT